jgi:Protein of unknown function (DUF4238)
MTIGKRHHFVPDLVLRNFADSSGRVWLHRPEFGLEITPTATSKVFVEKELNTIILDDGRKDRQIEAIFGKLETAASVLFRHLLAAARSGQAPELSRDNWGTWYHYFYFQLKRPPAAMLRAEAEISLDSVLQDMIAEEEAAGRLDEETKAALLTHESRSSLRQNALAMARIRRPDPDLWNLIQASGLCVLVVPTPSLGSFILGDVGIVPPSSALPHFFTAIAPDVALVQIPGKRRVFVRSIRDRAYVRRLNLTMAASSEAIMASDPEMLRHVARLR